MHNGRYNLLLIDTFWCLEHSASRAVAKQEHAHQLGEVLLHFKWVIGEDLSRTINQQSADSDTWTTSSIVWMQGVQSP
jgi:hypothetical protein